MHVYLDDAFIYQSRIWGQTLLSRIFFIIHHCRQGIQNDITSLKHFTGGNRLLSNICYITCLWLSDNQMFTVDIIPCAPYTDTFSYYIFHILFSVLFVRQRHLIIFFIPCQINIAFISCFYLKVFISGILITEHRSSSIIKQCFRSYTVRSSVHIIFSFLQQQFSSAKSILTP